MEREPQRQIYGPARPKTTFVLCFDGTGNKFSGTPADSNILKIFRMLDAADPAYHVYYQPGIGTYIQSTTYSHTSIFTKTYSWIQKTRDSMIGSSFDVHLMAGYKFLMKFYQTGDDIYIFGFSRGSYTARFLAQMLDMVGLLPAGNDEMARFAFKAFSRWQRRLDGTEEEKKKKQEMFKYMSAFRDTFSRPVRRIKFLGLFDTVNSVPRFEARFMKRSKFPYTAKSSALVIRHAVAIDERRAKFRQDLLGETRRSSTTHASVDRGNHMHHDKQRVEKHQEGNAPSDRFHRTAHHRPQQTQSRSKSRGRNEQGSKPTEILPDDGIQQDQQSIATDTASQLSYVAPHHTWDQYNNVDDEDEETIPSDVQEMWFPGGHADIGGGWPLGKDEEFPLSHAPLVWMVREAQKAGLRFRHETMKELRVIDDGISDAHDYALETQTVGLNTVPEVKVEIPSPSQGASRTPNWSEGVGIDLNQHYSVNETIKVSAEKGLMHDCLRFGQGTPIGGVLAWRIMEWLPFARMDLQPDNSWKAIRFPLPRGEVRDIPDSALIHTSALKRMQADVNYRPGNLIMGGGGRGVITAPKEYGTGDWEIVREGGNPIGECMIRKRPVIESSNKNVEKKGILAQLR